MILNTSHTINLAPLNCGEIFEVTVGELLARVEAVLRRAKRPQSGPEVISIGDVELDMRRLRATKQGTPLDLSPREFEILQFLIAHAGETVTRE